MTSDTPYRHIRNLSTSPGALSYTAILTSPNHKGTYRSLIPNHRHKKTASKRLSHPSPLAIEIPEGLDIELSKPQVRDIAD